MSQFRRPVSQLFCLPSKFRRAPQSSGFTLSAGGIVVTRGEFNWRQNFFHAASEYAVEHSFDADATQPSEDEEIEYEEGEAEGDEGDSDGLETEMETDLDERQDVAIPRPFLFDLAHKSRLEMMVYRLYVALSDDDHEIAALRTRQCEKFTHVVRITFDPPSVNNKILPSNWSAMLNSPNNFEPLRMNVRCPSFMRGLGKYNRALTQQQLSLARKFIAFSLPYRHDTWFHQGVKFPFSEEQCRNSRVLIVGPTDRSVDVMAILVSYLSSLTGARGTNLLSSMRKFDLVHSHWKNCLRGRMASAIINQK